MNWPHLLLGSTGRINRKTFLLGLLPVFVLLALVILYLKLLTGILPGWANIAVPALIALEAMYFLGKLSTKRMHDYGRPAHYLWLLFAPGIVIAGFLIQQKFFPLSSHAALVVVYTLLISLAAVSFLWMIFEMLFRRPDEQANSFGPPPA